MNAIVIEHVPVVELPQAWRDELGQAVDARVTVRIKAEGSGVEAEVATKLADDFFFGMWRDRENIADVAGYIPPHPRARFKAEASMHDHAFLDSPHRLGFLSTGKRIQAAAPAEDSSTGFGERLASLRKAAGFAQEELAADLVASQRMVAYDENPNTTSPAYLLPQIATALGVSIDDLFGREAPKRRLAKQDGNSRLRWRLLAGHREA